MLPVKSFFTFLLLVLFAGSVTAQSKKIIHLPDIPGYKTLKCDFHMHTVFSDGTVWPTVRVEEAWREGLDAIAITDHVEYQPHSKDIVADHNRSYEIAKPLADALSLILIRAAEITRSMPPGHINALFIENANLLERDDVFDALQEAHDQGAFLFWNHPGWKAQQPDTMLWWDEHTRLLKSGLLQGIEVYNSNEFYPEAINWAMDKDLTVFCNTDIHGPTNMSYNLNENHRPLTLVFAKNNSEEAIKDALYKRRTAAYFDNTLVGSSDVLEPLFFSSISFTHEPLHLENQKSAVVEITNNSDVDYKLELVQPAVGFEVPAELVLKAQHVTAVELSGNSPDVADLNELAAYYAVKNIYVGADKNLIVRLEFSNNN